MLNIFRVCKSSDLLNNTQLIKAVTSQLQRAYLSAKPNADDESNRNRDYFKNLVNDDNDGSSKDRDLNKNRAPILNDKKSNRYNSDNNRNQSSNSRYQQEYRSDRQFSSGNKDGRVQQDLLNDNRDSSNRDKPMYRRNQQQYNNSRQYSKDNKYSQNQLDGDRDNARTKYNKNRDQPANKRNQSQYSKGNKFNRSQQDQDDDSDEGIKGFKSRRFNKDQIGRTENRDELSEIPQRLQKRSDLENAEHDDVEEVYEEKRYRPNRRSQYRQENENDSDDDDDDDDEDDVNVGASDVEQYIEKRGVLSKSPFEKIDKNSTSYELIVKANLVPGPKLQQDESLASQVDEIDNANLDEYKEETMESIIKNLRPAYRPFAYNLAYFVNDSIVLQKFIEMGVNIKIWDRDREVCEHILRLDYEKNIAPHLVFLHDLGVKAGDYGGIIQKNPRLFKQEIEDLQVRINYLESKKFTKIEIRDIITKQPKWLNLSVDILDTKLGWFQREFNLTGSELREIILHKPKLALLNLKIPSDMRFCLKEFLQYDDQQIKFMFKTDPKLFTKNYESIQANFNYLLQVMKYSETDIVNYPPLLHVPIINLKSRFSYLKHLGLNQFDPTKPNFVSSKDLCMPFDEEFCKKITKTKIDDYQNFLKTL